MSRAAGLCPRCGGPKRGRSARASAPVAQCSRCNEGCCERHLSMIDGQWVCSKCSRPKRAPKAPADARGGVS